MKNQTFFIAEAAQGFEGNLNIAKELITAAKKVNADSIKFQMVFADELATTEYKIYNFFKKLEMSPKNWEICNKLCKKVNLKLIFDIFGDESLRICEHLKVYAIKIHPTDLNNLQLLTKVRDSKINKIILGVSGSSLKTINSALKILSNKNVVIMLGLQTYPTPNNEINNFKINSLKEKFKKTNLQYGYADHSTGNLGDLPSLAAATLGAKYIEKHITIKYFKNRPLEDYESALHPDDFDKFIKNIKFGLESLGSMENKNKYMISKIEKKYLKSIIISYIANKDLKKNCKILNSQQFILKRSSKKNTVTDFRELKNKTLRLDIKKGQVILKKYIK